MLVDPAWKPVMGKHALKAILYDRKGNVLSIGFNSYVKTHPLQAKCAEAVGEPTKVYLHAEIAALVRNRHPERAYKIVVFRFNKMGQPVAAKPCRCCQHALKLAGVFQIEHT